jgi:hypothetical protein
MSQSLANRLRVPGFLLLALMAVLPLVDFVVVATPAKPSQVAWRFGVFGQLSTSSAVPLLALLLLYALAFADGSRRMLLVSAVLSAVYALLLVAASLSFPLDALEMYRRVPAGAQPKFMLASAAAIVRLPLYALGAVVLTISQVRSGRALKAINTSQPDARTKLPMQRASLSGSTRPTPAVSSMAPARVSESPNSEDVPSEE